MELEKGNACLHYAKMVELEEQNSREEGSGYNGVTGEREW
jgi:hypothetical protein